ncbi:MAG: DUF438 domain-containing protein [Ignavibacteria bacterium]|nr:DUF438 domain-containing protein [Ignavibacteria bacterium]
MSELIDNRQMRMSQLKELISKIDDETSAEIVKKQIAELLKEVPYGDVVAVEQELFAEGVEQERMLKLCDLHSNAMKGNIDLSTLKHVPAGHPVDTFKKENLALIELISNIRRVFNSVQSMNDAEPAGKYFLEINSMFNSLMDIEKHYMRKENLLFPFLEKNGITGPSKVMWAKDDQIRGMLKKSLEELRASHNITAGKGKDLIDLLLERTVKQIEEMIFKEEQILFPMSLDALNETEWYEIYKQSNEIGYCLIAPTQKWMPDDVEDEELLAIVDGSKITLPTGNLNLSELISIFNTLPFDLTFVDKDDKVRYFSEGKDRIFQRNRAIIGRKVQNCHPPSSVHVVEKILNDFKSGQQDKAAFWINFQGKFVFICYYAVRDENGNYLGTLEVTQDLTELRNLEGERRILQYDEEKKSIEQANKISDEKKIAVTYDARPDLAKGIHPAEKVLSELETLNDNEQYLLITPFPPIPLINLAKGKGFSSTTKQVDVNRVETYFFK